MDFIIHDQKCYDQLQERFEYLFEPALINELCMRGMKRSYKPDEVLIDFGDPITHMPLVINGAVRVMTEDEKGQELLLYYLELGDTCAASISCCTRKSKSNIRAMSEVHTDVIFIPIELLEEWMITYKSWRAFILESYNTRLNEMIQAIDVLVFSSMEERILNYLKNKVWIVKSQELKISHADIARDLHSSRVVISRILKKLEQNGQISQTRGTVRLLNI